MQEEFIKGFAQLCAHLGKSVTLVGATGEVQVDAIVENGLDEYGIDEVLLFVPKGEYGQIDAAIVDGVRYTVLGVKEEFGDIVIRLERSR